MRYGIYIAVSIFFGGFMPNLVTAQSMFEVDVANYAVGDLVEIALTIDTGTESVNAVESKVMFSPEVLEFVSSDDRDSVIDLWIEKSGIADDSPEVYFAGLTPLGFTDNQAVITTLLFRVKQTGVAQISLLDPIVLRNDGLGTALKVNEETFTFSVINSVTQSQDVATDTELPEDFTPSIISDPDAFAGQSVVVFSAHDTGSGISHYEVKEGRYGQYVRTESPYILRYQALDRVVYVKAVDMAGNERIKVLYPQNWKSWYEPPEITAGIAVACLLLIFIGWYRYLRRRR